MLILTNSQWQLILNHALAEAPLEACGMLAGTIEGEKRQVRKVYLLTNVDQSPEHFSIDPKDQFSVLKDSRHQGWVVLGNFHSHPATPARPSDEDKRFAADPGLSYVIVSLQDKKDPIIKSFRISNQMVEEETIFIQEDIGGGDNGAS